MNEVAIRVEGLGKRYRIGELQSYKALRDTLTRAVSAPFRATASIFSGRRPADTTRPSRHSIWALKDVSMEIKHGEVVGIIGRNGAGKSTLLKILSRITEPTEGYAEVRGRVGSLLEVGTGFHPELTGRENVYLNGAILGMKKREINRKFDEIVAFAEIERFLDTPVKFYSSGMYVRLAFSVAAHLEPEILLVDEVLAVGDAEFQRRCLGKMQDVAGAGRTVIFVSHNMAAVQRLCSRAVLLEGGGVAHSGPVQQVIDGYLHSGMQQLGERVWNDPATAPGDDVARLRAVRACNPQGQVASQFKVTEPFCIEVEFWVLAPDNRLDVGLDFYNGAGDSIFVTSDFQDKAWNHRNRPVGIHTSRCHLPGNLLNEGTISVNAAVVTNPRGVHVIEKDAITLRIIDDFEPGGARGNYTREWPGGAVRPLMEWTFGFHAPEDEKDS